MHNYIIEFSDDLCNNYCFEDDIVQAKTPQKAIDICFRKYNKIIDWTHTKKVNDFFEANVIVYFNEKYVNYYFVVFNEQGTKYRLTKKAYKQLNIQRIIDDNWNSLNGKVILPEGYVTLYHGSKDGIKGDISATKSRETCDFGRGFYTGDYVEQAELLIKDMGSARLLYTLGVDISKMRCMDLREKLEEWVLYILCNRNEINYLEYPHLTNYIDRYKDYDVIIGLIADDRLFEALDLFAIGSLTFEGLVYCLTKVSLGNQYVFKNDNICRHIGYLDIKAISDSRRKELDILQGQIKQEKEEVIIEAQHLYPNGIRKDEFLRGFHYYDNRI